MTKPTLISKWTLLEKVTFRFSFIYFSLFIIIHNNGAYPFWDKLMSVPTDWLHKFIPWIAKNILNLPKTITTFTNGSGDTTYDYVIVLVIFIVAILGTIIWSVLDRNREHYKKMFYWLTVAIRFYVGLMLISYGLVKIIKLQFGYPSFSRLIQYYGESSPMGLAWTFLGFSKGYNVFMGIAEVLAGLLFFRRTMTAGAIITLMTAANVMAVNYFYDVPVKLLSTHLVLMTLFLLLRDIKTLFAFFFKGETVQLKVIEKPILKKRWLEITGQTFKGLIIGYALIYGMISVLNAQKEYGENAQKPEYYGLYKITYFEKNNEIVPASNTVRNRWEYFIIERKGMAQIKNTDNTLSYYKMEADTLKNEMTLSSYRDTTDVFTIKIQKNEASFNFETINKADSIKASGNVLKKEDFLLMNRGFNLINEYPYNR